MKVFTSDPEDGWTEVGTVTWEDDALSAETDDSAVQSLVERVNEHQTWDTAAPPEDVDAPVSEASEPMDEERSRSLFRTLALGAGYGVKSE